MARTPAKPRQRKATPPRGASSAQAPIIFVTPPPAPPVTRTAPPSQRKEKPMARRPPQKRAKLPGRVSQHVGLSYSKAVGDAGVEVGCTVSEVLFAGLSVAADYAADLTDTEVDNTALAYGKPMLGNAGRIFAGRSLAKKHPALAEVMRAGFSAFNGDSIGQSLRRGGAKVTDKTLKRIAGAKPAGG